MVRPSTVQTRRLGNGSRRPVEPGRGQLHPAPRQLQGLACPSHLIKIGRSRADITATLLDEDLSHKHCRWQRPPSTVSATPDKTPDRLAWSSRKRHVEKNHPQRALELRIWPTVQRHLPPQSGQPFRLIPASIGSGRLRGKAQPKTTRNQR